MFFFTKFIFDYSFFSLCVTFCVMCPNFMQFPSLFIIVMFPSFSSFLLMFIRFSSLITSHCKIKRGGRKHMFRSLSRFYSWGGGLPSQPPNVGFKWHSCASICHHVTHHDVSRVSSLIIHPLFFLTCFVFSHFFLMFIVCHHFSWFHMMSHDFHFLIYLSSF